MSIKQLPADVITQIKSSVVITALNGVVYGLVQNSLDASASRITVSVDYSRGNCTVEDDGTGIPPSDFCSDGGLGKLYYTSKYPHQAGLHGRHGTFLASLAALSLLTVSSHHHDFRSHNSITIHNSTVIARNTPALPDQQVLAFTSGTRVVVRDLFGSMPVRVKQRAIEAERLGWAKNFDQLLLSIVSLLLAWPKGVSVSLREASSRRVVAFHPDGTQQRQGSGIAARTAKLLTEASLTEKENLESWVPIGVSAPGLSVSGCVSLLPVATKRFQFIALGVQPVSNDHSSNILYEEVNRVFANSSFGAIEEPGGDDVDAPRKTAGFTQKELKVKKGTDRWPIFFLQIHLEGKSANLDADELLDANRGNLTTIVDLLRVMAHEFLKKHHFHPRSVNAFEALKLETPTAVQLKGKRKASVESHDFGSQGTKKSRVTGTKSRTTSVSSKRSVAKTPVPSPFAVWSRAKSDPLGSRTLKTTSSSTVLHFNTRCNKSDGDDREEPTEETASADWKPLFTSSGKLLRKPFNDVKELPTATSPGMKLDGPEAKIPSATPSSGPDSAIIWTDPATKSKTLVDPRTGFMMKSKAGVTRETQQTAPSRASIAHVQQKLPLRTTLPCLAADHFGHTEASIPCVPQVSDALGADTSVFHECRDLGGVTVDAASGRASKPLEGRISKMALQRAIVINQVDQKFILVKLFALDAETDDENASKKRDLSGEQAVDGHFMLVLIDQHAADERCRVESLMKEYFVHREDGFHAVTEPLEKPLRFELSSQDGKLLDRFKSHFEAWGISYKLCHTQGSDAVPYRRDSRGIVTVVVQTLPPSIMERCRLEPKLLIDLMRKEIWKLNDNPAVSTAHGLASLNGEYDWVARFHRCPRGILEMINSRACRSSIMFNDPLTVGECEELVKRLASSAFPFQCAHGRPSMVPLLDVGSVGVFGSDDWASRESNAGILGDMKSWVRKKQQLPSRGPARPSNTSQRLDQNRN